MTCNIRRGLCGRNGTTVIEYTLIGALISIAIVAGLQLIGPALNGTLNDVAGQVAAASP